MTSSIERQAPRIVAAIQERAVEALKDEAIERASSVAEALRGIVVSDDREASRIADQLGVIKDGQKAAKSLLEGLTSPLRQAIDVARNAFAPVTKLLDEAEASGKRAISGWQQEKHRRAQEEQARLEREAKEAAERQRAAGQPEAPPMEAPPPVVSSMVLGRRAATYETSVVCVEVVDPKLVVAFDASLMRLDETRAKAIYRELERAAAPMTPHPSGGVVVHGMRFWRDKRIGVR